jgi:phosphoribosylformylglycinamidine synthase I
MMRVAVVRFPGSNCDADTVRAAHAAGADAYYVWHKDRDLKQADAVILPGGFAYGDYLRAGAIARFSPVMASVQDFAAAGGPVLGICNGFQVLVKAGILPTSNTCEQTAGFTVNDSGRFEARWVHLRINTQSSCLFFKGLPEMIELPVAHGEGKLVLKSPRQLEELKKNKSIAMQYVSDDGKLHGYPHNPNGSVFNIAALSNPEGNCLGLMPHPERFTTIHHHPNWTRQTFMKEGIGLAMFKNAVEYCRS